MASQICGDIYDEIDSISEKEVRGVALLKAIGREGYGDLLDVLYTHIDVLISTHDIYNVIAPTISMLCQDGNMHHIHVNEMTEECLSKNVPKLEQSARIHGIECVMVSSMALLHVSDDDSCRTMEGIKTTLYHKSGILDMVINFDLQDLQVFKDTGKINKPLVIHGKDTFDHLFVDLVSNVALA